MTTTEQLNTLHTATTYGGSFVRKLAEAGLIADPANRKLIFDTFEVLTRTYGPSSSFYLTTYGQPVQG